LTATTSINKAETDILAEEFRIANFNLTVQRNYSEVSIMKKKGQVLFPVSGI